MVRINGRRAFYARHDVQRTIAGLAGKMPMIKNAPGPPMDLANMRRQSVRNPELLRQED
jgi:hypothetical protein